MTDENPSLGGRVSESSITRRTTLRRVGGLTAATTTGIATGTPLAVADNTTSNGGGGYETLDGNNTETSGDHSKVEHDCGKEVEITTAAAIDADSAPYAKGGPIYCYWGAQEVDPDTKAWMELHDLTVSIKIENANSGWNFDGMYHSMEKAPAHDGFEPSFGIGSSLFIYNFGMTFSPDGTENEETTFGDEYVEHNFGEVVDGSAGPAENQGWLRVQTKDVQDCDCNLKITTQVEAVAEYNNSGPGPCGTQANGDEIPISAGETFYVEITGD